MEEVGGVWSFALSLGLSGHTVMDLHCFFGGIFFTGFNYVTQSCWESPSLYL